MTGVTITLEGFERTIKVLDDAVTQGGNTLELFDAIGAYLVTSTQQRFEREEDPDGTPWPASIRALAEGGKTLTDTARLFQSFTHEASPTGVEVGTNLTYAGVHQFGAVIKAKTDQGLQFRIGDRFVTKESVTIPKRSFLGLDDADETEIAAIVGDWLLPADGGDDARI